MGGQAAMEPSEEARGQAPSEEAVNYCIKTFGLHGLGICAHFSDLLLVLWLGSFDKYDTRLCVVESKVE